MKNSHDSPALTEQHAGYPPVWRGRVPLKVRMATTVRADFPFIVINPRMIAQKGKEYFVWVNSYGAVSAVIGDPASLETDLLGLKPYEFEVVNWHTCQNPHNLEQVKDCLEKTQYSVVPRESDDYHIG
jgi:hypothetical protein